MQTHGATFYTPNWAYDLIKAKQQPFQLTDSPAETVQKMENKAGGLPQPEYFQSFPDNIAGPEQYARQVWQQMNQQVEANIAGHNQAAESRIRGRYSEYGRLDVFA